MRKVNEWYLVAKIREGSEDDCEILTPKGQYFTTFSEADIERIYLQPDYDERLVVLKRTCQIM
jgi:hypothetical protein